MKSTKKIFTMVLAAFLTIFSASGFVSTRTAQAKTIVPQVQFVSAPVTEYTVGDRVQFKIYAPNYSGKVEYRVVLWNDSTKSYGDLWHPGNGYPTCYYTKWQPKGNDVFTLGWPIFQPGSYRITVYAKRVGVPASKAYLKGYNCDSYMESVAFYVKPAGPAVQSILPINDISIDQGSTPIMPKSVKAVMSDGTQRDLKVNWGYIDTSRLGTFTIEGTVEGTTKKASVRVLVVQGVLTPYTVNAASNTSINVVFTNSLNFVPIMGRFSLKSPTSSQVQIYSMIMSSDQRSIQLATDYMTSGYWYILVVDGKEYPFNVPGSPPQSIVYINAPDRVVPIGSSSASNVTTDPAGATLYFTSNNNSVATVDRYTGRITGTSPGTAVITVTASKQGYNTSQKTFNVNVVSLNTVYAPVARPSSGEVPDGTSITLTTSTQGAVIYYTLDGTNPSFSSYRYTNPIVIHANTTIKAVAYKEGNAGLSDISTFVYTVKTTNISTNLWLRDKSYSSTNFYYIDWGGPFEITLDKSAGGRRIFKLHNVSARNIGSWGTKNYGDITFTETGLNTGNFTTSTWDGVFTCGEYWDIYEHSIKLTNGSTVELKMLNPLEDYPDYVVKWFK